jgi:hypothetical protein
LRRATWILPIIERKALPDQIALSGIVEGKGECIGDRNEKVDKGQRSVNSD